MPRPAPTVLGALACVVVSLAGAAVGVQASGPTRGQTSLGAATADIQPSIRSRVIDAYVPVADWGLRSRPLAAPIGVRLELRSLDRDSALAAFSSGDDAERSVAALEAEVRALVEREAWRAAIAALAGGLVGGLLAGSVIATFRRRRWLLAGPAAGVCAVLVVSAGSASALASRGADAFSEPTFYARGSELPKLLAFSARLGVTGDRYRDSYEQALAGVERLIAATAQKEDESVVETVVVASDLHLNTLVLPAFADFARGRTLFFAGDFSQLGSDEEDFVVPGIVRLGARVVAVSGNHDTSAFMRRLARAGAVVLTRDGRLRGSGRVTGGPVITVGGLRVAGFDDPLEADNPLVPDRELDAEERDRAERELLAWFEALPERPDVVLVHQHGLAHALLEAVPADANPLVIVTGHDHDQHLERRGPHVLVDGGTLGAGGLFQIGKQPAGFAQLHFAADGVAAADLVEVEPVSGSASARRVVIDRDGPEPTGTIALDGAGR